jgi:hypothetical protein
MPKIKKGFSPQELQACLLTLDTEDPAAQQVLLRDLCPCRARCYDQTVWLAICRALDSPQDAVQHQAQHAIETLLERAKTDEASRELRDWLLNKHAFILSLGRLETPRKKSREARKQEEKVTSKVTSQDMPRLLDILEGDQPEEKQKVLRLLCPCRNPHYNKEVWKTVFQTAEAGEDGSIRDQAQHAIATLRERARTDPRSQDLLQQLAQEGVELPGLEDILPVWNPLGRAGLNGLYIPRYEVPSRSKKNRARR